MGTRANITVKIGNKYHNIYTHWDGYPSHHGTLLLKCYNSQELAEKVVSLGDLSSLSESVDLPVSGLHSFERACPGHSVAYGRDRGETDVEADISDDIPEQEQEHQYLWDGAAWTFRSDCGEFKTLTESDCKD